MAQYMIEKPKQIYGDDEIGRRNDVTDGRQSDISTYDRQDVVSVDSEVSVDTVARQAAASEDTQADVDTVARPADTSDDGEVDVGTVAREEDVLDDTQEEGDDSDRCQESDDTDDSVDHDYDDGWLEDKFDKNDESKLYNGTHETQVSEGGEADLHKHHDRCKKNPGHKEFIPVKDFSILKLPEGFKDPELVECINAAADLTVRLAVRVTSTERPEVWPQTSVAYAFYDMRGSTNMRTGSGMVWDVNRWKDTTGEWERPCQCLKCKNSDTPSNLWGEVTISTARHVVFDNYEASRTSCRFFFDEQDSPLVTLEGWTPQGASRMGTGEGIEEDLCWLKCETCDSDLLDKLETMVARWFKLWVQLNEKYESTRSRDKLTIIISHPHGCPKQVSVGHWLEKYLMDTDTTKYTYTTCTCPGSSGAYVHPLGFEVSLYYGEHVHGGVNKKGENFSGLGRDSFAYR